MRPGIVLPWLLLPGLCLCASACDFSVPETGDAAWTLSSVPADGATGVARSGRLVVTLDRLVQPRSASPDTLTLRSGTASVRATIRVEPVRREIWLDIDPARPFEPETTYELSVDGLVDLDGRAQSEPYHAIFRTGVALGAGAQDPAVSAAPVLALLSEHCASARCHGASDPAAGLDLSSPMGIEATAVGALSHGRSGIVNGQPVPGALWLTNLRVVEVVAGRGDPAMSQLIYKVLGDSHVTGEPMPPSGARLDRTQLETLSAWVMAGAPTH